ncbi:MAG: glutathione S-transferase N-terminal domain-containing protein [Acidobacteriota bacterium]|jgi:glutathione S-transferase|nr:glutathione S-transferase N-terminal domain-containing protein [Acidobacteriota bacterium]
MSAPYRLITIPPSHYCEKARWALEKAEISYREEGHPPLFHRLPVKLAKGEHSTPVLVAGEMVLPDSTDILQFIDVEHAEGWHPYPTDSQLRVEAEELEEVFDTRLGPHTRRIAYYHLLQHKELFLASVLAGVGGLERTLFRVGSPLIKKLMRVGMRIDDEGAERSLGYVRSVFATVGELLDDGRPYLVGKKFGAADLTFAALAAPVLLPRNYGSPLPSLDEVPTELLAQIEEFRSLPAGEFALRIYRDHR